MLADDTAVESVVFGDAGVVGNLRQGGIQVYQESRVA
jgi:3-hydroxyisobutyrate dehydrogenase-like beta-hydroxyacid dehydrogenase